MDNQIVISTPPHVKSGRTTRKIMLDVIIALAPAAICGIIFFLVDALIIEITAVVSAVLAEFVYFFIAKGGFGWKFSSDESKALSKEIKELKKSNPSDPAIAEKESKLKEMKQALIKASFGKSKAVCKAFIHQFDFTSIVTGLILALILPSTVNWYEVAIGSVFAIMVIKMLFGGTGKNIANPAATGRVFMLISFSISVTTYATPQIGDASSLLSTGATYLSGTLLNSGTSTVTATLFQLFFGVSTSGAVLGGCIGETCKLALIIGYIYLVVRKVLKWWQPLLYIAVTFLLSLFLNDCNAMTALELTLSGGLLFGAIFMATDYVTSPKGVYGQIVYYVCLGILTAVLRHLSISDTGGMEVVSFAILIMNLFVPLIDRYIVRKPFGYKREKKNKEEKKNG